MSSGSLNINNLYSSGSLNLLHPSKLEQIHSPVYTEQSKKKNKFVNGTFLYIKDASMRDMLINAWNAITQLDLWDFVASSNILYLNKDDPCMVTIKCKMIQLGYRRHTDYTFNWVIKQMQYIAENGEKEYMYEVLKSNKSI